MKKKRKKTELNGCVNNFSVDYQVFDISDITNILYWIILLFIGLLTGIVSASNHKKCVFLSKLYDSTYS